MIIDKEISYCKHTIFMLKDWSAFQIAMRTCLIKGRMYNAHTTGNAKNILNDGR
jgi:hypothetical protein